MRINIRDSRWQAYGPVIRRSACPVGEVPPTYTKFANLLLQSLAELQSERGDSNITAQPCINRVDSQRRFEFQLYLRMRLLLAPAQPRLWVSIMIACPHLSSQKYMHIPPILMDHHCSCTQASARLSSRILEWTDFYLVSFAIHISSWSEY